MNEIISFLCGAVFFVVDLWLLRALMQMAIKAFANGTKYNAFAMVVLLTSKTLLSIGGLVLAISVWKFDVWALWGGCGLGLVLFISYSYLSPNFSKTASH